MKTEGMKYELHSNPIFNIVSAKEGALNRYDQALTHSSYAKEMKDNGRECDDYERLEFFGNFVLNFVVSEYIFKFQKFKDDSEGDMSDRMEIVSNKKLAEIIRKKKIGIEKYISLGEGQDMKDSIVADAFEALIGAVYLEHGDQGMTKIREVILSLLADEIDEFIPENYIGRLQEFVQINNLDLQYKEKKTGPDHRPSFRSIVEISGKPCGEGKGGSIRDARRKAARAALNKIKYKSDKC
ncbi:MAG: ribonuclease III domain-containing protein [Halobacteriota archaeon]